MSNKSLLIYNPATGVPKYTVDAPWPAGYEDVLSNVGESFIVVEEESQINPTNYWINPANQSVLHSTLATESLASPDNILLVDTASTISLDLPIDTPSTAKVLVNSSDLYPIVNGTVTINTPAQEGFLTLELVGGIKSNQIVIPVTTLASYRSQRWEEIKNLRTQKLLQSPTTYGTFDSDETAKSNLLGLLKRAEIKEAAGEPSSTIYRLADNSFVTLSLADLQDASTQISDYMSEVYAKSWSLEAQLNNFTTVEEIANLDIESGWPT